MNGSENIFRSLLLLEKQKRNLVTARITLLSYEKKTIKMRRRNKFQQWTRETKCWKTLLNMTGIGERNKQYEGWVRPTR